MRKYYIGLIVLMLVVLAAVGYTFTQGSAAKADRSTDKAVEDISSKLDNYYYDQGAVPATLATAGIKDVPSTVQYTKLSDLKYKVCFDYKSVAGGFDAGFAAPFLGGLGSSDSQQNSGSNSGYFDSSVESNHKKGQNCQTVTESSGYSPIDTSSGGTGAAIDSQGTSGCDGFNQADTVLGGATVSSIDTANKTITFSTSGQSLTDESDNPVTIGSLTYDADTLFCDSNYQTTTAAAIKAGDSVYVYMVAANSTGIDRLDLNN